MDTMLLYSHMVRYELRCPYSKAMMQFLPYSLYRTFLQTGSGKTHTILQGLKECAENKSLDATLDIDLGIAPRLMKDLYNALDGAVGAGSLINYNITVACLEIYNEQICDLLARHHNNEEETDAISENAKMTRTKNVTLSEHNGSVIVKGNIEAKVSSVSEMAELLARGLSDRHIGATAMNTHSSRSHAIFTITLTQTFRMDDNFDDDDVRVGRDGASSEDEENPQQVQKSPANIEQRVSKIQLVDLAGSERAHKTQARGTRLKEGASINRSLLALGNVINALAGIEDEKGEKKQSNRAAYIPYRDSKLTHLLKSSLGENAHTLMIACCSPADTNVNETVSTLRYAARARNIKNKVSINRDPISLQLAEYRLKVKQLQEELTRVRALGGADFVPPADPVRIPLESIGFSENGLYSFHCGTCRTILEVPPLHKHENIEAIKANDVIILSQGVGGTASAKERSKRKAGASSRADRTREELAMGVMKIDFISQLQSKEREIAYLQDNFERKQMELDNLEEKTLTAQDDRDELHWQLRNLLAACRSSLSKLKQLDPTAAFNTTTSSDPSNPTPEPSITWALLKSVFADIEMVVQSAEGPLHEIGNRMLEETKNAEAAPVRYSDASGSAFDFDIDLSGLEKQQRSTRKIRPAAQSQDHSALTSIPQLSFDGLEKETSNPLSSETSSVGPFSPSLQRKTETISRPSSLASRIEKVPVSKPAIKQEESTDSSRNVEHASGSSGTSEKSVKFEKQSNNVPSASRSSLAIVPSVSNSNLIDSTSQGANTSTIVENMPSMDSSTPTSRGLGFPSSRDGAIERSLRGQINSLNSTLRGKVMQLANMDREAAARSGRNAVPGTVDADILLADTEVRTMIAQLAQAHRDRDLLTNRISELEMAHKTALRQVKIAEAESKIVARPNDVNQKSVREASVRAQAAADAALAQITTLQTMLVKKEEALAQLRTRMKELQMQLEGKRGIEAARVALTLEVHQLRSAKVELTRRLSEEQKKRQEELRRAQAEASVANRELSKVQLAKSRAEAIAASQRRVLEQRLAVREGLVRRLMTRQGLARAGSLVRGHTFRSENTSVTMSAPLGSTYAPDGTVEITSHLNGPSISSSLMSHPASGRDLFFCVSAADAVANSFQGSTFSKALAQNIERGVREGILSPLKQRDANSSRKGETEEDPFDHSDATDDEDDALVAFAGSFEALALDDERQGDGMVTLGACFENSDSSRLDTIGRGEGRRVRARIEAEIAARVSLRRAAQVAARLSAERKALAARRKQLRQVAVEAEKEGTPLPEDHESLLRDVNQRMAILSTQLQTIVDTIVTLRAQVEGQDKMVRRARRVNELGISSIPVARWVIAWLATTAARLASAADGAAQALIAERASHADQIARLENELSEEVLKRYHTQTSLKSLEQDLAKLAEQAIALEDSQDASSNASKLNIDLAAEVTNLRNLLSVTTNHLNQQRNSRRNKDHDEGEGMDVDTKDDDSEKEELRMSLTSALEELRNFKQREEEARAALWAYKMRMKNAKGSAPPASTHASPQPAITNGETQDKQEWNTVDLTTPTQNRSKERVNAIAEQVKAAGTAVKSAFGEAFAVSSEKKSTKRKSQSNSSRKNSTSKSLSSEMTDAAMDQDDAKSDESDAESEDSYYSDFTTSESESGDSDEESDFDSDASAYSDVDEEADEEDYNESVRRKSKQRKSSSQRKSSVHTGKSLTTQDQHSQDATLFSPGAASSSSRRGDNDSDSLFTPPPVSGHKRSMSSSHSTPEDSVGSNSEQSTKRRSVTHPKCSCKGECGKACGCIRRGDACSSRCKCKSECLNRNGPSRPDSPSTDSDVTSSVPPGGDNKILSVDSEPVLSNDDADDPKSASIDSTTKYEQPKPIVSAPIVRLHQAIAMDPVIMIPASTAFPDSRPASEQKDADTTLASEANDSNIPKPSAPIRNFAKETVSFIAKANPNSGRLSSASSSSLNFPTRK